MRLYSMLLLALVIVGGAAFFSAHLSILENIRQNTTHTRTGIMAHSSRVGGQPGRAEQTNQQTLTEQGNHGATGEAETDGAQVAVRFSTSGEIIPERFVWRERPYEIVDQGRTWREEGIHYFLVTTRDGRIWQLRYTPATQRWSVEPKSEPRTMM